MIKQLWQKRWLRLSSYGVIAFGAYCGTLGYLLPEVAKSQLPKWVAENTNGQLSIADIHFHPLKWRLQIDQLSLTDAQQQPAFAIDQAILDLDPWRSLFNWQGQVRELTLTAPNVQVVSNNGELNFSTIFAPLTNATTEPQPPQPETEPQPIPLAIDRFALTDGRIGYQQDDRQPLQFTPLGLTANNLNFAKAGNRTQLTLTGAGDGQLSVELTSQITPLNLDVDLALINAQLAPYWQFAQLPLKFDLDDGRISANANIKVQQQGEHFDVTINDGAVALKDLALSHQQQPLLSMQSMSLDKIQLSLSQQQITAGTLVIDNGQTVANMDANGVDLADIFSPTAADDQQSSTEAANQASNQATNNSQQTDAEPWQLQLAGATINNWQLDFTDNTPASAVQWQLALDKFSTGPLSNDLTKPIELSLNSHINQQASFDFNGKLNLQPLSLESELSLSDFALLDTLPYWQQQLALKLLSGRAEASGKLVLAATEPLDLRFDGKAAIRDFNSQDPIGSRDLLKWQGLEFNGLSVATAPMALSIANITASKPYARIIIDEDGSTNLSQLFPAQDSTSTSDGENAADSANAATTSDEAAPLSIAVGEVLIRDGDAFFADNTLTPKFATGIEELNGRIGSVSSTADTPANVDIKGQVDRYAPVALKGSLQPFGEQRQLDLGLTFDNFELTSVNPYSGTYAGYYVDQGQLNLALNYQLDGSQLKGNNRVVLNQLKLGQRTDSDKATSLPVSLAIALMKDANGVIDLELDIAGNVDDPEFAVGPLVMKALGNIITKAVTAPFALLGNLLGGEPPAEFIKFTAGQSTITDKASDELKRLSKALAQRPGLALTVEGSVSPSNDRLALARQSLSQKLAKDVTQLESEQDWQALEQLAVASAGQEALEQLKTQLPEAQQWRPRLLELMLERQAIGDPQLADLAMSRAANTKQLLVEQYGLPADKVFIKESRIELDTRGSRVHLELGAGG